MSATEKKKLLDAALQEAAAFFPHSSPECGILCKEIEGILDELPDLKGTQRRRAVIQLWILERRLRTLGCLPCPFE